MGGHPCSTCKRAKADCDFGDRGWDSQQSISATNQRLSQLEKTVTELVAGLGHLTNPQPLSHAVPRDQLFLAGSPRHVSAPEHPPCLEAPPLSDAQTTAVPGLSPPVHSPSRASPEPVRSSSVNPRASERLESRWDALQHNSAPFPPLMNHPTAWSGEPSKTSPDAVKANLTLGMTHYKAHVHLQSEPVSEGIVSDAAARALFAFTLAIAGRYFNGYQNTQPAASRLPLITPDALEALADLAGAHLGFVLLRKQHELSDVQAALLLSVWIPRGRGQSADQWMVTGLCTRLAYRIGIPDLPSRPAVLRFASSTNPSVDDIHEVNSILPQWHTWLILNQ
ncbi:hypothetical protein NW755_014452 [Fusarium falciforme]|uniref:Zn(2)-C6 fungal-type domain-containing protein n=1 Tax=Fusarium falciforme TaxID=195108 RepID=A0A9W8QU42_9HYPO|nr:hypothetical protein NW755_014452 [Fusarium falciforme]